jgi:molybdopterin-guanine dinucleotide biosynthesis protein A
LTSKFKLWKLEAYVALAHKQLADKLEKYLKTGSGHAFAERHFQD